jgi:tetratricopeptide (TPR) repeat protein
MASNEPGHPPPRELRWDEAFGLGEDQYRAGLHAEAAAIFGKLLEKRPDNPSATRMLGLCRLRLDDLDAAIGLLAKARALAPEDPFARLHYGVALHAAGRYGEAAAEFRASATALPNDPAPFLNLAVSLLALGDAQASLDAAREAQSLAPRLPRAAYTTGMALLGVGEIENAELAFETALGLDPEFADAWVSLGVARYRRDDISRAIYAMRRARAVDPDHRAAAANLGAFLRLTGQADAAETLLRDLLTRDPDAAEARLNLAAALLQEERGADALTLLDDRSTPSDPRLAGHWRMQRLLALLQLGRTTDARAMLAAMADPAPELAPLLLWRRLLLALAEGDAGNARQFAHEMEQSLSTPGLIPEHRIMAHFDLAKFWSAQGDSGRAFPHWTAGHRSLAKFQPFSRAAHREFIDALIGHFDQTRLRDGPRATNRDPAPVFIVGMPRSGTTLAEQIIAAHPLVFGAGERGDLSNAFGALGGGHTPDGVARIAALGTQELDSAAAEYLATLHNLAPGAARIVDKMPGNFVSLGLAALMLPGARVIHCTRDPRDIGLSIFTFRFFGHHPYAHDLGDLGWYIAEYQRLMTHWYAALPVPPLTVRLQDWVTDFGGSVRRVLDFLGLPYDPACERFHEQDSRVRTVSRAQVRQPVNARGLGRWRAYEAHLRPLIVALTEAGALPLE